MSKKINIFLVINFCLIFFILLALEINYLNITFFGDKELLYFIHSKSNIFLDKFAYTATKFGTRKYVIIFSVLLSLYFFSKGQKRFSIYLTATILSSILLNFGVKLIFQRPRPHLWESPFPFPSDFSFPSGHAMGSITLALTLLIIFWGSRYFYWLAILALFYVGLIAWTRLYLGVHYPSDVVGGWLLGIAWTSLMTLLLNPHSSNSFSD